MTRSFAVSSFGFQYYRHVTSAANTVHGCPCCTCCGYTTRNTLYTTRNTLSFNAVDKYRQLNTFHGTVLYPHMYNTHTVGVHPPHQNTRLPPPLPEHQSIHNVSKRDLGPTNEQKRPTNEQKASLPPPSCRIPVDPGGRHTLVGLFCSLVGVFCSFVGLL